MAGCLLDVERLRDVTLDDADLMREVLRTLLQDTGRQLQSLRQAIARADATECVRLAHYSKGACATVGAVTAAAILRDIERQAAEEDFSGCGRSLESLAAELEKLRQYRLDGVNT